MNRVKAEISSLLPSLRRFAFSLTSSYSDADDLSQATVERLLTKPIPEDANLRSWAFKICRNLWIDGYRSKKVRRAIAYDDDLNQSKEGDSETIVETNKRLEQVGKAMKLLPPDQHIVLSMIAVQGCSYKEVSIALNLPVGTVMSRLSRARQRLIELCSPQRNETEGRAL